MIALVLVRAWLKAILVYGLKVQFCIKWSFLFSFLLNRRTRFFCCWFRVSYNLLAASMNSSLFNGSYSCSSSISRGLKSSCISCGKIDKSIFSVEIRPSASPSSFSNISPILFLLVCMTIYSLNLLALPLFLIWLNLSTSMRRAFSFFSRMNLCRLCRLRATFAPLWGLSRSWYDWLIYGLNICLPVLGCITLWSRNSFFCRWMLWKISACLANLSKTWPSALLTCLRPFLDLDWALSLLPLLTTSLFER